MTYPARIATCLLTLGILLTGPRFSPGQEVASKPDQELTPLDDQIKQFLEAVSLGQLDEAYSELLAGSALAKQDKLLKELVAKTGQLETLYGAYRGFEKINSKRIGRDLVLFRYLYKCERFPVVWYFAFYRTAAPGETPAENGTWRVITVRFDTQLELLWL
ncbi:MAG: hypothetical protein JXB62_03890 [Pirellulales bacterium]|nr:hypothetical protein [Pirellulales bacterium]